MIDLDELAKDPVLEKAMHWIKNPETLTLVEVWADKIPEVFCESHYTPTPNHEADMKEHNSALMLIGMGCIFESLTQLLGDLDQAERLVKTWIKANVDAALEMRSKHKGTEP